MRMGIGMYGDEIEYTCIEDSSHGLFRGEDLIAFKFFFDYIERGRKSYFAIEVIVSKVEKNEADV